MSLGMFRGKESSNRIELSRLVQDLLNFGVLGSQQLWGWGQVGGWGSGGSLGGGVSPQTCTCMHVHARTCKCVVSMIISFKWPPPLGEYHVYHVPMMFNMHVHVCACMCMHVCTCRCTCVGMGHPLHHLFPLPPHPPIPTNPPGGTPGISQNSIALQLIEIFQFCLKI